MGLLGLSLSVGALNGLVLALLLWRSAAPGHANRTLAVLVFLLAIRLIPYILGYAGFYDDAPWLTFFPFDFSFLYGPLFWRYLYQTTYQRAPLNWRWHMVPVVTQLAYWIVCFMLPLEIKWSWYSTVHLDYVAPIGAAIALCSASMYLWAGGVLATRYQHWLDGNVANRDEARLVALKTLIAAFGLALVIAWSFAWISWFVVPLNYFARYPLMLVFALLTYALALVGWRSGAVHYPVFADASEPASSSAEAGSTTRYAEQARLWRSRVVDAGWWRDESLDLATLAAHLSTSPRTLSRTLSQGMGQNFRDFIGRIRVESVAAALHDRDNELSILDLALAAGFNSKASFNRMFLAVTGLTPSAYRRRARAERVNNRQLPRVAPNATTTDRE